MVVTEAEPSDDGLLAAARAGDRDALDRAIPTLVVLRDGVLLGALPGAMPAKAIDELIGKVKALDMDEVRRKVDEAASAEPRVAKAGGA